MFMVMEFMAGGSIFDAVVAKGKTDEPQAAKLFLQAVKAVNFCHQKGVVHVRYAYAKTHPDYFETKIADTIRFLLVSLLLLIASQRDLKPENMMLDSTRTCLKLIDFGLAAFYKNGERLTEVCGSRRFQAPEVTRRVGPNRKILGYLGPPVDGVTQNHMQELHSSVDTRCNQTDN